MFSTPPKSKVLSSPLSVFRNLLPRSPRTPRKTEKKAPVASPILPEISLTPPPSDDPSPGEDDDDLFVPYLPLASRLELETRRHSEDDPDIADDVLGIYTTFPEPPSLIKNPSRTETPTPSSPTNDTTSIDWPEKVPIVKKDDEPKARSPLLSSPTSHPAPFPEISGRKRTSDLESLKSPRASSRDWILTLPSLSTAPSSFNRSRSRHPTSMQWSQEPSSTPKIQGRQLFGTPTKLTRRKFRSSLDLRSDTDLPLMGSGDSTPATTGRRSLNTPRPSSPFHLIVPDSGIPSSSKRDRISLESLISRASSCHPFSSTTTNLSTPSLPLSARSSRASSPVKIEEPHRLVLDPSRGLPVPIPTVSNSSKRRSVVTTTSSNSALRQSPLGYRRTSSSMTNRISGYSSSASSWWDSDDEADPQKEKGYYTAPSSWTSFLSLA